MRFPSVNSFVAPFAAAPALDGWVTVSTGFVIVALISDGRITLADASLLAGCFMAGTFVGGGLIGRLADRFGRRIFARILLPLTVPLFAVPLFINDVDVLIVVQ